MEHQYKDAYQNTSPPNLREEFEIAKINLAANPIEEDTKYNMYEEHPYIPAQDPRSVNVINKIKEGVPYLQVEDDAVKMHQLIDILEDLDIECDCEGEGGSGSDNPNITPEDPDGDGVIEID